MNSITDGLLSQLQGNPLQQISQQLGIDSSTAASAVAAALPLLIGTLGRNARHPDGASSLFGALQEHRGQDLDNVLSSQLTGRSNDGEKILGHVFGPRQELAAQGLGSATGLQPDKAKVLLRWLAPLALGYIAKRMYDKRHAGAATPPQSGGALGHGSIVGTEGQDTTLPTPTDLSRELGQESERIQTQGGLGGGLLGAVLDRNHDGRVDFSDLVGLAGTAANRMGGGGLGNPTR
jgi:hypothetical protein